MHAAVKYFAGLSACVALAASVVLAAESAAQTGQAKYTVKVEGGLAFAEFKGYEGWQVIALSSNDKLSALILGNPIMIEAYKAGIPENGKPFPDGAKMAKIHYNSKKNPFFPDTTVPGALHDIDFMVKDSKRFADSNGWGYGAFEYNIATDTFTPATGSDTPPQAHDAKCGAACHTIVKANDYVFTEYGKR